MRTVVDIVVTGECSNGCVITWRPVVPESRRITVPTSLTQHADLCQVRPVEPPRYLNVAEVAARMRVSKMTVYRAIHDGSLKCTRVGRQMRLTQTDVDAWLRELAA